MRIAAWARELPGARKQNLHALGDNRVVKALITQR